MSWQQFHTTYSGTDQNVPEPPTTLNWKENKQVGPTLLQIEISNNCKKTVKVVIKILPDDDEPNALLPLNGFKVQSFGGTYAKPNVCGYLQKIDPTRPFGKMKLEVIVKDAAAKANARTGGSTMTTSGTG